MDGFGCFQIVFGGFKWLSEICSFSIYGGIRCFKLKRSRQLWKVFVVSTNNGVKVPLKYVTKFMVNIVSLKRPWVGKRGFFLSKLTYIALCKFSWF